MQIIQKNTLARFNRWSERQNKMREKLSKDLEEYHLLVHEDIKAFSWSIFAGFLLARGWTNKEVK